MAPHADPARIQLRYSGQDRLAIDADGSLVYDTPLGRVRESAPVLFQDIDGQRVRVEGRYTLLDDRTVGFQVSRYDRSRALTIDPVLSYAGFIGGNGDDEAFDVDIDAQGNAYITGHTNSTQATFPVVGGPDLTHNAFQDAFVAKISADGSTLIYLGYIGGNETDIGYGIAVDGAGNAYVTGMVRSNQSSFPVVMGPDSTHGGEGDAFVAKVNASGTALLYSGYVGGNGDDEGFAIDVDANGAAYLTGYSRSVAAFPVLVGPDLTRNGADDVFVAKVQPDGVALAYSGYIGGDNTDRGYGIAVDPNGNAYVTGETQSAAATFPASMGPDLTHNGDRDAFVAKVSADGSTLSYAGYIGGSGLERGFGIAVDPAGNAYVTGATESTEATFPVLLGPDLSFNGGEDAFVSKITADGSALVYSGYIGGNAADAGRAIAVNRDGEAHVAGETASGQASFPELGGPDLTHNGGADAFVAKIAAEGAALEYAGYLGGDDEERANGIAVDEIGNAYVTGFSASSEAAFPVMVGPDLSSNGSNDAFVARVNHPTIRIFRDSFE